MYQLHYYDVCTSRFQLNNIIIVCIHNLVLNFNPIENIKIGQNPRKINLKSTKI